MLNIVQLALTLHVNIDTRCVLVDNLDTLDTVDALDVIDALPHPSKPRSIRTETQTFRWFPCISCLVLNFEIRASYVVYCVVYLQSDGNGAEVSLNIENTLWSNTVVASGTVLGLVVYTGYETRSVMNTSQPTSKVSSDLKQGEIIIAPSLYWDWEIITCRVKTTVKCGFSVHMVEQDVKMKRCS